MLDVCRVFLNSNGGIVPIGDLRKIIMTANHYSTEGLFIGNDQNLFFDVSKQNVSAVKDRLGHLSIHYDISEKNVYCPIVHTGYLKDLVDTTAWLTETYFVDIVNTFDHAPKISIRLVDPLQTSVAHKSSQLNFIASSEEDYWYVFFNLPESSCLQYLPILIHTNDIARFSLYFERYYFFIEPKGFHLELFVNELYLVDDWNFKNYTKLPNDVHFNFFQFEGLHKYDNKKYYLGIFHPLFKFKVDDLERICILCIEQNIGFVYLTANRSLLIKNIAQDKLNAWTDFLSLSNINTHHSITDLCWNIHGNDVSILKIKKHIASVLLKLDTRCEDIIIGINNPATDRFYSIEIVEKYLFKLFGYKCFVSYFIYYKKDLNPYNIEILSFADNVLKGQVFGFLSFLLTQKEKNKKTPFIQKEVKPKTNINSLTPIYECIECKSRYDSNFGDGMQNIEAGILFDDLPEQYCCSVCGAEKKSFAILKEYK